MIGALAGSLLGIFALASPASAASDLSACLQPGTECSYDAWPIVDPGADASPVSGGAVSAIEDAGFVAFDEVTCGYDKHSDGPLASAAPAPGVGRVGVAGSPEWILDGGGLNTGLSALNYVAPRQIPGVQTPYGIADQATDTASLAARADVESGTRIWRVGTTGRSNAADAQFWSLEHPSTPGFADRYEIPAENVANADFIESAVVPSGTPFITRQAPGVGSHGGGGIEVVVPEGSVTMCGFSVTGGC